MDQRPLSFALLVLTIAACDGGSGTADRLDAASPDGPDAAGVDAPGLDAHTPGLDAHTPLDAASVDAAGSAADAAAIDGALPPADAGAADAAGPLVPQFTKYASNPVLSPSGSSTDPLDTSWDRDGIFEPTVVATDDGSWVMFYVGNDGLGAHYAVGRGVSSDGIHWTVDATPSLGLAPDISALRRGGAFNLYYVDHYEDGVRLATSTDGVSWNHAAENPVIDEPPYLSNPSAVENGTGVQLWYVRRDFGDETRTVFYASSPDGINFTIAATNLTAPLSGDLIGRFSVIRDGSGGFELWMARGAQGAFYMTSPDGITWTEHGLSLAAGAPGAWDEQIRDVTVVRKSGALEMWYAAGNPLDGVWHIGYATSP